MTDAWANFFTHKRKMALLAIDHFFQNGGHGIIQDGSLELRRRWSNQCYTLVDSTKSEFIFH